MWCELTSFYFFCLSFCFFFFFLFFYFDIVVVTAAATAVVFTFFQLLILLDFVLNFKQRYICVYWFLVSFVFCFLLVCFFSFKIYVVRYLLFVCLIFAGMCQWMMYRRYHAYMCWFCRVFGDWFYCSTFLWLVCVPAIDIVQCQLFTRCLVLWFLIHYAPRILYQYHSPRIESIWTVLQCILFFKLIFFFCIVHRCVACECMLTYMHAAYHARTENMKNCTTKMEWKKKQPHLSISLEMNLNFGSVQFKHEIWYLFE